MRVEASIAIALTGELGTTPATSPRHHGGFLGGEYGRTGEPEAFAAALHEALTADDRTTSPST